MPTPSAGRPVAFLTLDDPAGFVIDDDLAVEPLAALGWRVESVPWRADVDWGRFEAVVIRSPWDYQDAPDDFLAVLGRIEAAGTRLENGLGLVRWNLAKTYLRELDARGVPIVPTRWDVTGAPGALFDRLGTDEVVVKPVISANADGTFRLARRAPAALLAEAEAAMGTRPYLAQPFVPSVVSEGEFSLFYFDGALSHAILKTPKAEDFRVQEEHGGLIRAVAPEPALVAAADRATAALGAPPLYARADLVRAPTGGFWLMELELIEPALYFRMDPGAPARFARAFDARMRRAG